MSAINILILSAVVFSLFFSLQATPATASVQAIYKFQGMPDGAFPVGSLTMDAQGNLYGTTSAGGAYSSAGAEFFLGYGTVFKLSPPAAGATVWRRTILHSFDGTDGAAPQGNLLIDSNGVLYGTTPYSVIGPAAGGTVFAMIPPAAGHTVWKFKTIYAFTGKLDGSHPAAGLVGNPNVALFGMTNARTAFKLMPPAPGGTAWTLTTLTSDLGTGKGDVGDCAPLYGPSMDAAGNLYGVLSEPPGASCIGKVIEVSSPVEGSKWTVKTLLQISKTASGEQPLGPVLLGVDGNLYGTAESGYYSGGLVYRLSPPPSGKTVWSYSRIASLAADGGAAVGSLIQDSAGNLYGAAPYGGSGGFGIAFKLAPPAGGATKWTETRVSINRGDGYVGPVNPNGGLVSDATGTLYGVTNGGGAKAAGDANYGTVYKIVP